MYDTFAIITRRGTRVSPAMQEFLRLVTAHMTTVAKPVRRPGSGTGSAEPAGGVPQSGRTGNVTLEARPAP